MKREIQRSETRYLRYGLYRTKFSYVHHGIFEHYSVFGYTNLKGFYKDGVKIGIWLTMNDFLI